jgi:hypothetical protein
MQTGPTVVRLRIPWHVAALEAAVEVAAHVALTLAVLMAGAIAVALVLALAVIAAPLGAALIAWVLWRGARDGARAARRLSEPQRRARALRLAVVRERPSS